MHALLWIIFAVVYLGMALGRLPGVLLDRTGVALLGAIAMIGFGGISLGDAARAVDFQTILLLFSLMLFSAQLGDARFYRVVGNALTRGMARPKRLLAAMIFVSAGLSALLANDIVCLAFTPVLVGALLPAKRDPIPYLVALATSCNIGSAATIIGNPQNMYIGVAGQLAFGRFTLIMLPIVLVALGLCWCFIVAVWPASFENGVHVHHEHSVPVVAHHMPFDRPVVYKTLLILAALVVAFVMLPATYRVVAALVGGGLLLISRRRDSATLYKQVDWDLLLLFFGLFVVNGAMKQSGLTAEMMRAVARLGIDLQNAPTLVGVTTVLSNIVSNVPAVLLIRPSIAPGNHQAWYLLAMASTWAGNLTLVGSIANLIVAEQAARLGVKLDLKSYCKAGIPLTIVTVAMGTAWLMWVMKPGPNAVETAPPTQVAAPLTGPVVVLPRATMPSATQPSFSPNDPARLGQFLADQKNPNVILLGDSISDLWRYDGGSWWMKLSGEPYRTEDYGVISDCIENTLAMVEEGKLLDRIRPKVVVLLVGTNNMSKQRIIDGGRFEYPGDSPNHVAAGILKVVDAIHAKLGGAKILVLGIFPRMDFRAPPATEIDDVNQELAEKIAELPYRNQVVFDARMGRIVAGNGDGLRDGIHPTHLGYQRWYEAMKPVLDRMLGLP